MRNMRARTFFKQKGKKLQEKGIPCEIKFKYISKEL